MRNKYFLTWGCFFILGIFFLFCIEIPLWLLSSYEELRNFCSLFKIKGDLVVLIISVIISILVLKNKLILKELGLVILLLINYLIAPFLLYFLFFNGSDGQQLFYLFGIFLFNILFTIPVSYFYSNSIAIDFKKHKLF